MLWTMAEKQRFAELVNEHGVGSWQKLHKIYAEDGGHRTRPSLEACYRKNKGMIDEMCALFKN